MINAYDFKIRASQTGLYLTPTGKKTKMTGKVLRGEADKWIKESIYGIRKSFSDKRTEKGTVLEDKAIDKAIQWLDLPFILKNEQRFTDSHFTGEPDLILDDRIIDIKTSWDAFTFPLLDDEIPDRQYIYQVNTYMHLTGIKKASVVYVLLETPDNIDPYGPKYDYSNVPNRMRIRSFNFEYDPNITQKLIEQCEAQKEQIQKMITNRLTAQNN